MNYFGIGHRRWYLGRMWKPAAWKLALPNGRTYRPGTFRRAPR